MANRVEFTDEKLFEIFQSTAERMLIIERATAIVMKTLQKIVIDKKLVTEEEYEKIVEEVSNEVDKAFGEYLQKIAQALVEDTTPKNKN